MLGDAQPVVDGAVAPRRVEAGGGPDVRGRHAVATRDHHVDPGAHFAEAPDFVATWPPHCVVGTEGVSLHPYLETSKLQAVFDKGEYAAAYSGFEGFHDGEGLADWLRRHEVNAVEIVGIATDHCVRATALDAAAAGFVTTVRLDLTAGVVHPDFVEGDVYRNVTDDFQVWWVNVIYIAAMVALGFHINHGFWSASQTLGINSPTKDRAIKATGTTLALVISLGFIAVPVAVMTGITR